MDSKVLIAIPNDECDWDYDENIIGAVDYGVDSEDKTVGIVLRRDV